MLFSFVVVTYNHERYIAENLESIRHQVLRYGTNTRFQLIVSDDCSTDDTVRVAEKWIDRNSDMFVSADILRSPSNLGTCKNYARGLRFAKGDVIKAVAGDDVLPFNSVLELARTLETHHVVMGMTLPFEGEQIDVASGTAYALYQAANEFFFSSTSFGQRLRLGCPFNAPSVMARRELLQSEPVLRFVEEFAVIDDYSQWLMMSDVFRDTTYRFVPQIGALYRRTPESVSLVRKGDFATDRIALYDHLIARETNFMYKLLQRNGLACFKSRNGFVKKYCDITNYVSKFAQVITWRETAKLRPRLLDLIESNNHHLASMRHRARQFVMGIDSRD